MFKGSEHVHHKRSIILTSLSSSPAFLAWVMFKQPSASQPTPFIQFRSERYWFCTATTEAGRHLRITPCLRSAGRRLPAPSYLALQRVRLLGLLHLDVVGHDSVVVQLGAVLQVAGQGLGLLGVAQVDHVLGEGVVGLALLGALLVLDLGRRR